MLDILPLDELTAALREFHRVLRPGGRLVLANVTPGERRRGRLPRLLYALAAAADLQLPRDQGRAAARRPRLRRHAAGTPAQMLMPSGLVFARR